MTLTKSDKKSVQIPEPKIYDTLKLPQIYPKPRLSISVKPNMI